MSEADDALRAIAEVIAHAENADVDVSHAELVSRIDRYKVRVQIGGEEWTERIVTLEVRDA